MDLFGLISLSDTERAHYEAQTALYYSSFYDDNAQPDIRGIISNVTVFISVTDQVFSAGFSGTDCSTIDPLSVIFTIEMSYYTNDPAIRVDDVIQYPFSTLSFQETYINSYLKANDSTGGFQSLLCVSEIRLEGDSALSPTNSPALSIVPTTPSDRMVDDIFIDDFNLRRSGPIYDRKCSDTMDSKLVDRADEFELSFVYGMESTTLTDDSIEALETIILDYVSASSLKCFGNEDLPVQLLRREDGILTNGVIRVRYPQYGEITTVSKYFSFISFLFFSSIFFL